MAVKKKVLGRGLGALIGDVKKGAPKDAVESPYFLCEVERVRAGASQPRKTFNDVSLKELADSIKENGIIEPLVARKEGASYALIAGERRLRAAKLAGLKKVPLVVMDVTDQKSLELAIVENVQREDLNAIEEAEAYQSLVDFGLSQDEVAKKVGKERATVANYLRLLKLPPEVKDEIKKGSISMGHARALLSVEGHARQRELCKKVMKHGLSVRETEKLSKDFGKPKLIEASKKAASSHLSELEEEFRRIFGTKVLVKDKKGKGRIQIEYYTGEERERLIDLLRSVR